MNKIKALIFLISLTSISIPDPNMIIHKSDGTTDLIPLSNIRKITHGIYSSSTVDLIITNNNASLQLFPVTSINRITFNNPTSFIESPPPIHHTLLKARIHPNPCNPSTVISYYLPFNTSIYLSIFNTNGRLIKSFSREHKYSGYCETIWDLTDNTGNKVSSGNYIIKLQTSHTKLETFKLTVLK